MRTLLIVALFFFAGCGYRFETPAEQKSVSISPIKGENEGQLTCALVDELVRSGRFEYRRTGGLYRLEVEILNHLSEQIGFQYDRGEFSGKRKHNLLPMEGRRSLTVRFSLVQVLTGDVVVKPTLVTTSSDYDYVDVNSLESLSFVEGKRRRTVLDFSLGQLDSIEGAEENALKVAYAKMARMICEGIRIDRQVGLR